jgi:hypothetical protein
MANENITIKTAADKMDYYQRQYESVCALLRNVDPCEIRMVGASPQCVGIRCGDADADPHTLCCTACAHLGNEGCKVKALGCKMWLCGAAIENMLAKAAAMPREVGALLKEIQETHRTCEFYGIPCRSRHSMRENLDGIINPSGYKPSKQKYPCV